jgi:carbonic anhydrase
MRVAHLCARDAVTGAVALAGVSLLLLSGCGGGNKQGASSPSASSSSQQPAHWSYEGADGPDKWGQLSADYAACSVGKEQSPIDLPSGAANAGPDKDITIEYKPGPVTLENNGHTIQANIPAGNGSKITINGEPYQLVQFHFHLPSEHTLNGKNTAMELHFVHKNAAGKLAVLGVMMDQKPGPSPFDALWKSLPAKQGDKTTTAEAIDFTKFLPAERGQYQYKGSLTTPPCSEGVAWTMLKTPVPVTPKQVAAYRDIFHDHNTNRPVQPLDGRELISTSS